MTRRAPRIVLFGPAASAPGGIAQFTQRLAEALAATAAVEIVAPARLYPALTAAGRASSPVRALSPVPERLVDARAWEPWTWRRARREVTQTAPDLLVVQWWHPAFGPVSRSIARSASRAGARIVLVCHNARPHEPFPMWRALTAAALRTADHVVTMSEGVTGEVRSLAPRVPVTQLEHPPNLALSAGRLSGGARPRLLFFGNVRPYKGLDDLLLALPAVREEVDVTLTVAGRFFGSEDAYRRRLRRLGLQGTVDLRSGYVPDAEVGPLLGSADLLVLPYRSASQSGIVALAAQTGTPVVATSAGGLPQVLGPGAIVADPGDPGSLARAIVRALHRPPPPPPPPRTSWDAWSAVLVGLLRPVATQPA